MAQLITRQTIQWTPIGQTSNQLILYHPPSHALSVRPHPTTPAHSRLQPPQLLLSTDESYTPDSQTPIEIISRETQPQTCPYCFQPLPTPRGGGGYFEILETAHEGSRPPTPDMGSRQSCPDDRDKGVSGKGYYERYFREECQLGMGAEGSVYLATHVIGGNVLGQYAVKKIAVGSSQTYLVKMLREVRLLETLRHPNIIPYHHAWIDQTRFSSFGPSITALHVLMMYATAGNLDSFLLNRTHSQTSTTAEEVGEADSLGGLPREERIKAFKKRRQSRSEGVGGGPKSEMRGVMMLGLEEIVKLFGGVVEGLAFLHSNSILHLDLKCSNVLLHWEEGQLIPRAMISDFGTSEQMIRGKRERTGHTGTMEYMAPETLIVNGHGQWRPSDSHADMWSLGLILHKLLFLHLPYAETSDFEALQAEIISYPGFIPTPELIRSCERRHIPRDLLILLSKLVNVNPEARPSADKVKTGLRTIDVRTPATGFNGLVTRFTKPFAATGNLQRTPPIPFEREVERNWENDMSPVRPVLALPSPKMELLGSPSTTVAAGSNVSNLGGLRQVRTVLLAVKVLSLQPTITGMNLGTWTTVTLVIVALGSFLSESLPWGYMEMGSGLLHALVLMTGFSVST